MNLGKLATAPLIDLLAVSACAWIFVRLRCGSRLDRAARRGLDLLGACLVLLAIVSLPATTRLVERTLLIDYPGTPPPPDVIVVLAGGYGPEPTIVSDDTTLRVNAAVAWWKRAPAARIVMAGESAQPHRSKVRPMTELMAEMAEKMGVPPNRILRDTWSVNTRTHPLGLLRLPGITPDTKVGLVTSPWHLRRATAEFRRHFRDVEPWYPRRQRSPLAWEDFVPNSQALHDSTTMIHEWIGIAWYRLLHALGR